MSHVIQKMIERGVIIPFPATVSISPEVVPENIQSGVVLHPGSRIQGAETSIGAGSVLGAEGPAVVNNCQLGRKVKLGSGFFDSSVFLDGAAIGGGAHVRPGCLIEEEAGGAHTVGLKQTVLMSYVTLGSLINFCDCLMAGGTSRKNHSEVGSSFIHFNYSPHQDKATPSLIGDVVHGVLLKQSPIFLGGQGGLVGPVRIAFGTVIPAGQIIRHDILNANHLVYDHAATPGSRVYDAAVYGATDRIVLNNLLYIGNIKALKQWYLWVRKPFMSGDPALSACHDGAVRVLSGILSERIKRLDELSEKLHESAAKLGGKTDERSVEHLRQQKEFISRWPSIKAILKSKSAVEDDHPGQQMLMDEASRRDRSTDYSAWVAGLDEVHGRAASDWLGSIVAANTAEWKS